jgi:hypothetical protein
VIVYPTWETTPSPQSEAEVKTKKKKKKVISIEPQVQQYEQLSLFIEDYANNQIKPVDLNKINFDSVLQKLSKKISELDLSQIYQPLGDIPFPKVDLDKEFSKFKSLNSFNNSIYLEAFNKANNISSTTGSTTVTVEVTKDQLPPALFDLPNGGLSNSQVAEMFGLPLDKLLSISVSVVNDNPLHDFDDPIYKVDIERTVPKIEDFF